MAIVKLQHAIRKGYNKAVQMETDFPAMRITGNGGHRQVVSLYTAMELSTLVKGSGDIEDEDMAHTLLRQRYLTKRGATMINSLQPTLL